MHVTVSLTDDSGITTSLSVSKAPSAIRYPGKAAIDLFDENENELSAFTETIELIAKHLAKAHTSITFAFMMTYMADARRGLRKQEAARKSQPDNKPSASDTEPSFDNGGDDSHDDLDCP